MSEHIDVSIFEDNNALRNSLNLLIDGTEGLNMVGLHGNGEGIQEIVKKEKPQVILMDLNMPVVGGLEAIRLVREMDRDVKIIVLTVFEDNEKVFTALQCGADGYLLKKSPPNELLDSIRKVMKGGAPLTPAIARMVVNFFRNDEFQKDKKSIKLTAQETKVLRLLSKGNSYKMIADHLFVSIDTIRSHIKNIYKKLQVHSKSEAVQKAVEHRIL